MIVTVAGGTVVITVCHVEVRSVGVVFVGASVSSKHVQCTALNWMKSSLRLTQTA